MKPTMLGIGKVYNIKCTEVAIPEFPDILFGQHEDGSKYFNATNYLKKKPDHNLSVEDFFQQFNFQIKCISEVYQIPFNKLCIINQSGEQLVAGCLCYLFISYTVPSFNAYVFERIDELFQNGVTISDSFLAENAQQRFTPEVLKELLDNGEKTA